MAYEPFLSHPRSDRVTNVEHDELAKAKRVTTTANSMQEFFDYGAREDGQPVYAGHANKGVGTDESSWLINKYTYNESGFITSKQSAYGAWDNRGSLSYE